MNTANERGEFADFQHEQFRTVHDHVNRPAEAAEAAADLLRWYAEFGELDCKEAQGEIEEGMRRVLHTVALAGIGHEGRCWITPLDYFQGQRKAAPQGRKKKAINAKATRLALRMGFGDHMSWDELMDCLTTYDRKTFAVTNRAKTLDELVARATEYIKGQYKSVTKEEARAFVLDSFSRAELEQALADINQPSKPA